MARSDSRAQNLGLGALAVLGVLGLTSAAVGQGLVQPGAMVQDASGAPYTSGDADSAGVPPWIALLAQDPDSPAMRAKAAQNKARRELEMRVRKVRHAWIVGKDERRAEEGFARVRDEVAPEGVFAPGAFTVLLDVFARDARPVRLRVLDLIRDAATDESDTTLAWVAVMDRDGEIRAAATSRLLDRIERRTAEAPTATANATGTTSATPATIAPSYPPGVALVVHEGLRTRREHTMAAAATLASTLGMIEAIPWLIAGQVSGAGFGGNEGGTQREGDLAWILVGTQQAFVSDLTPVVGDGAVGFDPELSVVTSGVVLRIKDAAVYAYHFGVHDALLALASGASGTPRGELAGMGFDNARWREWYAANRPALVRPGAASASPAPASAPAP
jgi:hypothetical protein